MVKPTIIDMRYKTLHSTIVLFNTYEIKANGKLLSVFKAFEERDMNSLKDLIPNAHFPVSKR